MSNLGRSSVGGELVLEEYFEGGVAMNRLSETDFAYFSRFLKENSEIVVAIDKEYLIDTRLSPIQKKLGLASLGDLINRLRHEPFGALHNEVIEAMTTNETYFFRDVKPFEALRNEVLPELIKARASSRSLSIWSAACSSGQEAYSIQMILKDSFPNLANWNTRLLCTDLSQEMVSRTLQGRFTQLEVNRGLPAQMLIKHFQKVENDWQVKPDLKVGIEAKVMNLAKPWPTLPVMDIVFLRNVLIYFDLEAKSQILGRVAKVLAPDGILFLGGSETTLNISNDYERRGNSETSYYVLKTAKSHSA